MDLEVGDTCSYSNLRRALEQTLLVRYHCQSQFRYHWFGCTYFQSGLLYRAALMTTTDLSFPAFSLRLADFTVPSCFHCNKATLESSLTVIFLDQSQFIAMHSNK